MNRALVILVLALALPAAAQERMWRLGVLTPGSSTWEPGGPGSLRATTLPVLAKGGFIEGQNLVLVGRAADGDPRRLPELARDLADERVDVVIAVGGAAADAVMAVAPSTPIVMSFASEDPVQMGYARSLAHPGGKVTGTFFRALETDAKRLELLAEAMPQARRFGFLAAPTLEPGRADLLAHTAARLGVELMTRTAHGAAEYADAFASMKQAGAAGVLVQATTVFGSDAPIFSPIAAQLGIPTICEWDYMARQGCVMGFGPDLVTLRRHTGEYVLRIFKGADPGELPIELPDRFILAVNLRAAGQLGLAIPQSILARADEIIE